MATPRAQRWEPAGVGKVRGSQVDRIFLELRQRALHAGLGDLECPRIGLAGQYKPALDHSEVEQRKPQYGHDDDEDQADQQDATALVSCRLEPWHGDQGFTYPLPGSAGAGEGGLGGFGRERAQFHEDLAQAATGSGTCHAVTHLLARQGSGRPSGRADLSTTAGHRWLAMRSLYGPSKEEATQDVDLRCKADQPEHPIQSRSCLIVGRTEALAPHVPGAAGELGP